MTEELETLSESRKSKLLFVEGIDVNFQTTFGTRLPTVIGESHTFVPTTLSILLAGRYKHIVNPHEVGLSQTLVD